MTSTVMDLASGSLGGIAGTIVGHPFDTVKGKSNTNWIILIRISKYGLSKLGLSLFISE